MSKKTFSRLKKKRFTIEALEARRMMAADFFFSSRPWDTTGDGLVSPLDALVVVNELNTSGSRVANGPDDPLDVNKDYYVSPIDALSVINELNVPSNSSDGSNIHMFLSLDGIQGDVNLQEYKDWIDISSFSFDSRHFGGDRVGVSELGDLQLVAPLSSAMPELAAALAQGKLFATARLVVAQQFGNKLKPVNEWKLDDVQLGSFDTATAVGRGSGQAFSLKYDQVEWTYYRYDDQGQLLSKTSKAWDTTSNSSALTAGWAAGSAVEHYRDLQQLIATVGQRDMQLFLSVDGIQGDAAATDFKDWIDISSFSFESRYLGDNRAGAPELSDLQLVAPLSSAMPDLALALAQGKVFPKARLVLARIVGDDLKPVSQWELRDCALTSFDAATAEGQGSGQAFSLRYDRVEWTYYRYDAAGKPLGSIKRGWDVERTTTALTAGWGATSGVQQYHDLQQVVANVGRQDMQLFLSLDGLPGDVTLEEYENWIDISSFSFESRVLGDGRLGPAELGDLQLVAPLSSAMPELALALAQGKLFPKAPLVLARQVGGELQPVSQWELADVMLSSFDAAVAEGQGSGQAFSLEYSKVEWTYYRYDAAGKPLNTIKRGWDLNRNAKVLTAGWGTTSGVHQYRDLQQVVAATGERNMQMFLSLDGIKGDVKVGAYKDWIDISSFSFESRYFGDGGRGRSELGDLQLVGPLSSAMPELAIALANGMLFPKARLVMAREVGGHLVPINQWELRDVGLSSFDTATAEGRGSGLAFSLTYEQIEWTYYRYGQDGKPLDTIRRGWDVERDTRALTGGYETITAVEQYQDMQQVIATTGDRNMRIFLNLSGIKGDVNFDAYKDWIDVSSYSFESRRYGNARAGVAELGDLQLVAPLSRAMPDLALALAQGKLFSKARLVLARQQGDEFASIAEWELRDCFLSSFDAATAEGRGSGQAMSLKYDWVQWTYYRYGNDGQPLDKITKSWDVAANATALTAGWGATSPAEHYHRLQQTIASVGSRDSQLFLNIDGLKGDVTVAGYKDWIDISSYSFESRYFASGGRGTSELGDVQLVGPLGSVMPELASALAQGKFFPKARLVLTGQVAGTWAPLAQWELKDVILSSFDVASTEGRGSGQALSLGYSQVEWKYYRYNGSGQLQETVRTSWDNSPPSQLGAPDPTAAASTFQPDAPQSEVGSVLTQAAAQAALAPIVDAAIAQWLAAGASRERLAELEVVVSDLPNPLLGLNYGNVVLIDADGAGHGWFIDDTPQLDEEFVDGLALADGPADGRFDLLTALSHEIGHFLGLEHEYGNGGEEAVMQPRLCPGQRYHPANVAAEDRARG